MIKKLFFTASIILSSFVLFAQQIDNEQVATALKTGNASEIAKHFSSRIELNILDDENNYSKAAAEARLFEFFEANQPEDYKQMHEGNENDVDYVIGVLSTESGEYQVSYYLIKTGETHHINQFIIAAE